MQLQQQGSFDFGLMAQPKTEDVVYLQGYLTPAASFYVDIFFNEGGELDKQTFLISKDTERIQISSPLTNAAGEFIPGQPAAGWVITAEIGDLSFFRCYLGIKNKNGFFNLQPQFRSNCAAFWGVTGIAFNPVPAEQIPSLMVISPVE